MTEKQLEQGKINRDTVRSIENYVPYIRNMGDYTLQLVHKKDPNRIINFDSISLKKGEKAYVESILTEARREIASHLDSIKDILNEEFKII